MHLYIENKFMNDSLKTKAISKSGLLLKNILDISNVGQRECAENMGEHDQYLRNYIYTDKEIKLGRNFCFNFLAAIYHSLSINRKNIRVNICCTSCSSRRHILC